MKRRDTRLIPTNVLSGWVCLLCCLILVQSTTANGQPTSTTDVALPASVIATAQPASPTAQPVSPSSDPPVQSVDLSDYIVRSWTTADGLPGNHINQVFQSSDGFIWLATGNGLVRFNGISFEVYNRKSSVGLTTNYITRIVEDTEKRLWLTTRDNITVMTGHTFTAVPGTENANEVKLFDAIVQGQDGSVWMVDNNVLYRDKEARISGFSVPDRVPGSAELRELSQQLRYRAFPVSDENILYRLVGDSLLEVENLNRFSIPRVTQAVVDRKGVIWLLTETNQVYRLEDGSAELLDVDPGIVIYFLIAGFDENLWFRTSDYGIYHWTGNEFNRFATIVGTWADPGRALWAATMSGDIIRLDTDGIQLLPFGRLSGGRLVTTVTSDREGGIWIGTDYGLYYLHRKPLKTLSTRDGLSADFARPIIQTADGTVWVGTWGGGVNRRTDSGIASYSTSEGLPSPDVWSLYEDASGNVWIGTNSGGLSVFDKSSSEIQTVFYGTVQAVTGSLDGTIWFSDSKDLYYLIDDEITIFPLDTYEPSRKIWAIHVGRQGNVWVGTEGGVYRVDPLDSSVKKYTGEDGLAQNFVVSVYEDTRGDLWFTTHSGGISRFHDGVFVNFTARDGLYSDGVWRILEDDLGFFWMSSDQGIFRVDVKELDAFASGDIKKVHSIWYTEADGMITAESNRAQPAGWKMSSGELWFPTLNGIVIFDPVGIITDSPRPEIKVWNAVVDGIQTAPRSSMDLLPGVKNLEFDFSVLSYVSPEKNQFRYRLDGFEKDWHEGFVGRRAAYTNVQPGSYTFRVVGANNNGLWNTQGDSISIRFREYFYESWWFYLSLVVIVVGTVFLAVRYRVRLGRHKALDLSRRKIASDLHDDIGSRIGTLALSLEMIQRDLDARSAEGIRLSRSLILVRKLAADFRDSLWIVHSEDDDLPDLVERMESFAEKLDTRVRCFFNALGPIPSISLDMEVRRHIFLIYKEAVFNAIRHSSGKRVEIDVRYRAPVFSFSIIDDGQGFDHEHDSDGYGLRNMQWRAEEIGGNLNISSSTREGTTVRFDVRLAQTLVI